MKNGLLFCSCAVLMWSCNVGADSITLEGQQFTDVLVYESADYYYVKLPQQGKSLSVRKSEVPADTVTVNNDGLYRDELRAMYNEVKSGARAAVERPVDSAFTDVRAGRQEVDTSALFATGGSGKPLALSIDEAKAAMAGAGITLSDGPGGLQGQSGDGIMSVKLSTKGSELTAISGSINSTDPTEVQGKAMAVIMLASKVAPWAGGWVMSSQADLMSTGSIQKSQDGVSISLSAAPTGLNFNISGS